MAKIKKIKLPNIASPFDLTDAGAVRHDESTSLSDNAKAQARTNIDAASASNTYTKSETDSALSGKQDTLVFNTAYNASTNKVATMVDVQTAGLEWGEF